MCFKGVAASVFKSLKFPYWVTGLSLTWNFEVLEVYIYSYFQCFLRGPPPREIPLKIPLFPVYSAITSRFELVKQNRFTKISERNKKKDPKQAKNFLDL